MQKTFAFLIVTSVLFFSSSCTGLNGRIEDRLGSYYLVNKSETKKYRFTLKRTQIQDDSIYSFNTELIELSPGDEKYLSAKELETDIEYPIKEKQIFQTYKPLTKEQINQEKETLEKEKKDGTYNPYILSKLDNEDLFKYALDTIINGEKLKYRYIVEHYKDSSNPLPVKHFKYNYEVTGQVEIKEHLTN